MTATKITEANGPSLVGCLKRQWLQANVTATNWLQESAHVHFFLRRIDRMPKAVAVSMGRRPRPAYRARPKYRVNGKLKYQLSTKPALMAMATNWARLVAAFFSFIFAT